MRFDFIPPMMPTLVDEPPDGDEWQHEIKYDGYRTELLIEGGSCRAFTRKGHDWSDRYAPLLGALRELCRCDAAILDGEVIVQGEGGRSDFHELRASLAGQPHDLVFMAFDLLALDGKDMRRLPIEERRARLAEVIGERDETQPIQFSADIVGNGADFFAAADRMGLEGIVSKRRGSRYRSGYAKTWLKTKTFGLEEYEVVGVERGDRAPVALLARETGNGLAYVGGAMVTLPAEERDIFWGDVETLKTDRAPLATDRKIKEGSWVRPGLRLEVKSLRGEEMLRHATVERIVARPARPKPARKAAGRSEPAQIVHGLPPRDEIADYYRRLAPAILRWAGNRPLNLFRCEGAYCFFQRNRNHPQTSASFEAPIRHVRVAQKNGKTETYLYIEDEPGVMACVDAQSIEFHGWGSRVADIERPDRIAIDLDPDEGIGFAPVKAAAFEVRDHLEALGLESFPLLSGGKGVHVVIPLTPHAEWAAVRDFTLRFCEALAEAAPERFTVALPKEQRRGRIFLDYLRNQRTATAIMPYSVRARPGGPVAAPVTWQELEAIESAQHFTIADAGRLARRASSVKLGGWGISDQRLAV